MLPWPHANMQSELNVGKPNKLTNENRMLPWAHSNMQSELNAEAERAQTLNQKCILPNARNTVDKNKLRSLIRMALPLIVPIKPAKPGIPGSNQGIRTKNI